MCVDCVFGDILEKQLIKMSLTYDRSSAQYRQDLTNQAQIQRLKPFSYTIDINAPLGSVTAQEETIEITSVSVSGSCYDAALDSDIQIAAVYARDAGLTRFTVAAITLAAQGGTTAAAATSVNTPNFIVKRGEGLGVLATSSAGAIAGNVTFFGWAIER